MARLFTTLVVLIAVLEASIKVSATDYETLNQIDPKSNQLATLKRSLRGVLNPHGKNTILTNQAGNGGGYSIYDSQHYRAFLRSKRHSDADGNVKDDLLQEDSKTILPNQASGVTVQRESSGGDNQGKQEDGRTIQSEHSVDDNGQILTEKESNKDKEEHQVSNEEKGTEDVWSENVESSLTTTPTFILDEAEESSNSYESQNFPAEANTAENGTVQKPHNCINVVDKKEKNVTSSNDVKTEIIGNKDCTVLHDFSSEIVEGDVNTHDNKLLNDHDEDDVVSNVKVIDDSEEAQNDDVDRADVDTFLPFKSLSDQPSLGQLRHSGDSDEEYSYDGSGDMALPDADFPEIKNHDETSTGANEGYIFIDDDKNNSYVEDDDEDQKSGVEDETAFEKENNSYARGKQITIPKVNDGSSRESQLNLSEPSGEKVVDPSVTYNPLDIINPLGLDNPPNLMDTFGFKKVFGLINLSEEGSGSDDESPDSFKTDEVFKVSTEKEENTTIQTMDISRTVLNKTRTHQVNLAPVMQGSGNEGTVFVPKPNRVSPEGNDPINEAGINKGEKETESETNNETATSSTGSFVLLGAIMITIVALLGYSVVKSHRQKRQAAQRRPPSTDSDTELKEIEKFIQVPEKSNHQGGNQNGESEKLLFPNASEEKKGFEGDGHPSEKNGVRLENGIAGNHTNGDLSEVKVEGMQKSPQNTLPNTSDLDPENEANDGDTRAPAANGSIPTDSVEKNSNGHLPGGSDSPKPDDRGSWVYGTGSQPESAKTKMFTDHDSIPKKPIRIMKRGSSDMDI